MSSTLSFKPPLTLQMAGNGKPSKLPIEFRTCTVDSAKDDLYSLRYRAFIKEGIITPRDDEMFFDVYDDLATSCSLGAYHDGACVGTFRLAFGQGRPGAETMPCQSGFPLVALLEKQGFHRVVEFGRMVVEPSLTNTSFRTTLYASLVRAGLIVTKAGGADYGLISVHPKVARFYELMCGFSVLARAESYPGINAPAVLLGRDFRILDQKRIAQNPFFYIASNEVSLARAQLFPVGQQAPAV